MLDSGPLHKLSKGSKASIRVVSTAQPDVFEAVVAVELRGARTRVLKVFRIPGLRAGGQVTQIIGMFVIRSAVGNRLEQVKVLSSRMHCREVFSKTFETVNERWTRRGR